MSNRKRLTPAIVIATIVLLLIAAAVILFTRQQPSADSTTNAEARIVAQSTAPDPGTIFAEGRLAPQRHAMLSPETGGLVQDVLVAEGEAVAAGDALFRLDGSDAEISVRQAQAALAQAEANVTAAQARLQGTEEGVRVARLGIDAAEAQRDTLIAAPQAEAVALAESAIAAANAGVAQAAGERDVTLEIDTAAIAAAEARLEAAEANLFAVRVANEPLTQNPDLSPEEREQAQLQLNAAIAAVDAVTAEIQQLQQGATEAEARAANSAVSGAAQQRAVAQAELDLLQVGARTEAIDVAEGQIEQARQSAAESEAQADVARAAVRQAQAQLAGAQANLQAAQTALDRRTPRAPFAAVIADILVKEGEIIAAGTPVLIMADLSSWQVQTTDLSELDVVNVREGQEVQLSVDAFPDENFSGEIVQIARAATALRDDVTYEVTVALRQPPGVALRWGMTAFITVK